MIFESKTQAAVSCCRNVKNSVQQVPEGGQCHWNRPSTLVYLARAMASYEDIKWIYITKYEIRDHQRHPSLPLGTKVRSIQSMAYAAQPCYTATPTGEQEKGGRKRKSS